MARIIRNARRTSKPTPILVILTISRPRSSTIDVSISWQNVIVRCAGTVSKDSLKENVANVLLISTFNAVNGISILWNAGQPMKELPEEGGLLTLS